MTSTLHHLELNATIVRAAHAASLQFQRPLLDILEEQLQWPEGVLLCQLGLLFRYSVMDWTLLSATKPAFEILPFSDCVKRECIPVRNDASHLIFVVSNPFDADILAWLENTISSPVDICLASRANILAYLGNQEETLRAMDQADALDASRPNLSSLEELSLQSISEHTSPVVRLVNSTLYDALKSRASDIHFEATAIGLVIKYRIDGVLAVIKTLSGIELGEQVISRIKVMAELDISEHRIPQDGRFQALYKGREIDFRVSVMPSIHGEDTVVRILDKRYLIDQMQDLRLDHLGFNNDIIHKLRRLAAEPYGMLLVTGPTGSGKTTTLYAVISEVNQGLDKIITIEDPVEYQLAGVLQIPVNEKKGLTFARGLRSILRHDPDRIMIGEIRDPETAEIAVQSALTGHLVYTTVHANNVIDVMGRLLHMKIDPHSFVSALNGVLAQRLIRLNCTQCVVSYTPDPELLNYSHINTDVLPSFNFSRGTGCGACRGSGYAGRKAIGELLVFNDELREMVVSRAPARLIKERAAAFGTQFLRDTALELVKSGLTTLEEANRVTFIE